MPITDPDPDLPNEELCQSRYCPVDVAQAIYGGVSGATYDSSSGFWSVPCDAEIDMALQFGFVHICSR